MYYYIFDPPQAAKEYEQATQIKQYISTLGIAGEMVQPQPGRTIEQLVEQALQKRYSTLIAVGGMALINRMAAALAPYDAVFGIIPLFQHPDIRSLIGTDDWKTAAEQLKRRRWGTCRLGVLQNGAVFLTPAQLELAARDSFTVQSQEMHFQCSGGQLTITPSQVSDQATILLELREQTAPKKKWWQQFGSTQPESTYSRFLLPDFELSTSLPVPVLVAGNVISQTPLNCRAEQKLLKLIAANPAA